MYYYKRLFNFYKYAFFTNTKKIYCIVVIVTDTCEIMLKDLMH